MSLPVDQIVCGDNCETLASFPAECIDLVVTSPPYDDLRTYGGHSWDFERLAGELWRTIKPGGVVVWVVGDQTIDGSETGTSFRQALRFMELGFRLHDTMIWNKTGFTAVGSLSVRYGPVFEFMFVFVKGEISTFNPIKDRKVINADARKFRTIRQADGSMKKMPHVPSSRNSGDRGIRYNIWDMPSPGIPGTKHPATFPEALARDHILSWSNEGDLVVDPFAGSFTTCKMAKLAGRHWIGIEVNAEYCEIGRKRMSEPLLPFMEATDEPPPPATARELFG